MPPTTQYQQARQSLAMFGLNGLPSNESLPFLPPLPDTPVHSRRIEAIPEGIVTSHVERLKPRVAPATELKSRDHRHRSTFADAEGGMRRTQSHRDSLIVDTHYPTLSTRQSGVNPILSHTYTNTSTLSSPGLEPITNETVFIAQPPSPRRQSASFQLPTQVVDASLIADCSLLGEGGSSINDDADYSVDVDTSIRAGKQMGIADIRPPRNSLPHPESLGYMNKQPLHIPEVSVDKGSTTPTKKFSTRYEPSLLSAPKAAGADLDKSTILPHSPAKTAHLLTSAHALNKVEPPWSDDMSIDLDFNQHKISSNTAILPGSQSLRGLPSSTKSKRTFPASSSAKSLASVGEEPEDSFPAPIESRLDPDVSTLLPYSPEKAQYLLTDDEMIFKETLFELPTFRGQHTSSTHTLPTPRSSPRRSPIKLAMTMTPAKHATATPRSTGKGDLTVDMTLDVKDLMAKISKPKRASGTEESFVDLLHGEESMDGMDASMLGDETILPLDLRPAARASPVKGAESPQSSSTSGRTVREGDNQREPPFNRLPTSQSTRTSPTVDDEEKNETEPRPSGHIRSKSMSKVAEILNRVRADHLPASFPSVRGAQVSAMSPPKTVIRPRTSALLTATPGLARPRTSIAPRTIATSRRISLSTGALPITTSASQKILDLPQPQSRPTHDRTASSHAMFSTGTLVSSTSARRAPIDTAEARPAAARAARPSVAPTSSIAPKTRTGSTQSTASTRGMTSTISASRFNARPSTITTPSVMARPTASASSTSRLTRTTASSATRPAGLPQPAPGPSARSAPISSRQPTVTTSKLSRGFGTDASTTTNRVPRPSAITRPTEGGSKLSIGPSSSTMASKRSVELGKSRALSTPATAIAPPRGELTKASIPPVPTIPSRQTTHSRLTATGLPKPRTEVTVNSKISSGMTRTGSSRLGLASTAAGALTTGTRTLPHPSQGTASLRTRLDQLQTKPRVAK